jgi:membrane associated rhomboid family serine protease
MFPLKDTIRARSFPAVNWLLIAANVLVFVLIQLPLSPKQLDQLVMTFGLVPARLAAAQPQAILAIFTSMFMHGGWFHLVSNMWALYIFGDNVEDRMGSIRYLVFYLLSGVVATLTQTWLGPASRVPLIGASGAIAGVLGAYLILFPAARVITLIPLLFLPWFVEIPAVIYLGFWFVSQFFNGLFALDMPAAMGGVAYWAHIGGFVCGVLLVWLFARRPPAYHRWYPDEYRPW